MSKGEEKYCRSNLRWSRVDNSRGIWVIFYKGRKMQKFYYRHDGYGIYYPSVINASLSNAKSARTTVEAYFQDWFNSEDNPND